MPQEKPIDHSAENTDQALYSLSERPCGRLVQISDPHLLRGPLDIHRSINTTTTLESVVNHAQTFIHNADAVLITGDIAQDEQDATYARLRETWTNHWIGLETQVWCLPGNHDAPVHMHTELGQPPFYCLGHHQLGNWEVIMLDTRNPGSAAGLLGTSELARLESRLDKSNASHILIGLHHHPLPLRHSWLDKVGLEDRDDFKRIIGEDERVKAVLFGHIHQAFDRSENGVRYLGCPSTGAQFTPHKTGFELDNRPPGFRHISLYQSGAIQTQAFWVTDSAVNDAVDTAHREHA